MVVSEVQEHNEGQRINCSIRGSKSSAVAAVGAAVKILRRKEDLSER